MTKQIRKRIQKIKEEIKTMKQSSAFSATKTFDISVLEYEIKLLKEMLIDERQ